MKNLLVLSVGRRTKLIRYLRTAMNRSGGLVVCADCDVLAPALYLGDRRALLPNVNSRNYLDNLLQLCKAENIGALISLTDPELTLLSRREPDLNAQGVMLFHPAQWASEVALDKLRMSHFLAQEGFNFASTRLLDTDAVRCVKDGLEELPIVIKPRYGSASNGVRVVDSLDELEFYAKSRQNDELIVQQFLEGEEYGVDAYVDYFSGGVISQFAKRKIRMRSGETDKSVSIIEPRLERTISRLLEALQIRGPADVDAFMVRGEWYISEVNPRFGGGYPHAHEMGCDFATLLVNNVNGKTNPRQQQRYSAGTFMMKCDDIVILREEELLA